MVLYAGNSHHYGHLGGLWQDAGVDPDPLTAHIQHVGRPDAQDRWNRAIVLVLRAADRAGDLWAAERVAGAEEGPVAPTVSESAQKPMRRSR